MNAICVICCCFSYLQPVVCDLSPDAPKRPNAHFRLNIGYLFEIMPRRQETVKVAAVQAAPVSFDLPRSLAKVAHFTAEAAKAGADLVVFP